MAIEQGQRIASGRGQNDEEAATGLLSESGWQSNRSRRHHPIEGTPLTPERLRQLSREARASSAAITLVLASVGSAFAAVAGLPHWVPVVAAIAAVLSGAQVVWNELVIPMRIRSAENATHYLVSRGDDQQAWRRGTAFQFAPNLWVTAQHVIRDCNEILLRMKGGALPAQVLYQNADTDLAVLEVNNKWAW